MPVPGTPLPVLESALRREAVALADEGPHPRELQCQKIKIISLPGAANYLLNDMSEAY